MVDHNTDTAASRSSQSSDAKNDGFNRAIVPFGAATLPKLGSGAIPRPRANPSLIERQVGLSVTYFAPFEYISYRNWDIYACCILLVGLLLY